MPMMVEASVAAALPGGADADAEAAAMAAVETAYCNDGPGPVVRYTIAEQVKKGEDCFLIDVNFQHGCNTFGVYGVFDGHNGVAAAKFTRDNIMRLVLDHLPPESATVHYADGSWLSSLPLAMAEAFLECHNLFASKGITSGTTATLAIVSGWVVTVAAVGDSRAILDTVGGGVTALTIDHRFEDSQDEQRRVLKEGGRLARLRTFEGIELGPLRSWPGGLCVSRSIGDVDCGSFITPLPHVKQIRIPRSGGRIMMASDGLWDAVDSNKAAKCCRGMPSTSAAPQLVKESIRCKGLRDDITVIVIDLLPSNTLPTDKNVCPVPKGMSAAKSLLSRLTRKKSFESVSRDAENGEERLPCVVNDHDSMRGGDLYRRYRTNISGGGISSSARGGMGNMSMHAAGNFCAVCGNQVDDAASEVSVRAGNVFCSQHRPGSSSESAAAAAAATVSALAIGQATA